MHRNWVDVFAMFFRLDFANFVTGVATTGACTDSFVATTPSGVTTTSICGTNTGLHSKAITSKTKQSKENLYILKPLNWMHSRRRKI
jgi:hypothetical protein